MFHISCVNVAGTFLRLIKTHTNVKRKKGIFEKSMARLLV